MVVQAIAGTHVVLLGWDVADPARRQGLLGFAVQREYQTEGETYWLRGMKTFPGSTPLQTFQWGDYTAKAAHNVFFNRGAVASQEYARRFANRKPSVVGEPAYTWLSRGQAKACS
jgi:hypothetical protein